MDKKKEFIIDGKEKMDSEYIINESSEEDFSIKKSIHIEKRYFYKEFIIYSLTLLSIILHWLPKWIALIPWGFFLAEKAEQLNIIDRIVKKIVKLINNR